MLGNCGCVSISSSHPRFPHSRRFLVSMRERSSDGNFLQHFQEPGAMVGQLLGWRKSYYHLKSWSHFLFPIFAVVCVTYSSSVIFGSVAGNRQGGAVCHATPDRGVLSESEGLCVFHSYLLEDDVLWFAGPPPNKGPVTHQRG